jgi:2-methylcitrate dehydratase
MAGVSNRRPAPDKVLIDIARYVADRKIAGARAYRMARYCLTDALGCAFEALDNAECLRLLGPIGPDIVARRGVPIPGTAMRLDPLSATFTLGTMIRWVDSNDAILAAERGHPSDNIAGILAVADYLSRKRAAAGKRPLKMREVLTAIIKAYEIQWALSVENSFTDLGFDHAAITKIATAAVATQLLGGSRADIINAVSNAWADGLTLKVYRQTPNVGTRKNWAGADAACRGVRLAFGALKGEMGIPSVLTAKKYGFYEAIYRGRPFRFAKPYGTDVFNHVLFKTLPADMLSQTAVECAFRLHPLVRDRIGEVKAISIATQAAMISINDKSGPLHNPSDRDHCAQYVIAVGLLHGRLRTADFEDDFAADPRIDRLRDRMTVVEDRRYTRDFYDPAKRAVTTSLQVHFNDGSSTPRVVIEYPIGHPRRRREGMPLLEAKFSLNLARRFPARRVRALLELCGDQSRLEKTAVHVFMNRFARGRARHAGGT